jgi:hypothetical protein
MIEKKSQTDRVPYFPRCVFTRPSSQREWLNLNVISRMCIRGNTENIFLFLLYKKLWVWDTLSISSLWWAAFESEQMTQEEILNYGKKKRKRKKGGKEIVLCFDRRTSLHCSKCDDNFYSQDVEWERGKNFYLKIPFMAHIAHSWRFLYKMALANAFLNYAYFVQCHNRLVSRFIKMWDTQSGASL